MTHVMTLIEEITFRDWETLSKKNQLHFTSKISILLFFIFSFFGNLGIGGDW